MGGPTEDKILKFWDEQGIGKAIEDIRKKQAHTAESFIIEMLRRPEFSNCRADDIELRITTGIGTPNNPYEITVSYAVKLKGRCR